MDGLVPDVWRELVAVLDPLSAVLFSFTCHEARAYVRDSHHTLALSQPMTRALLRYGWHQQLYYVAMDAKSLPLLNWLHKRRCPCDLKVMRVYVASVEDGEIRNWFRSVLHI